MDSGLGRWMGLRTPQHNIFKVSGIKFTGDRQYSGSTGSGTL